MKRNFHDPDRLRLESLFDLAPLDRGAGGLCHRTGPDIFLVCYPVMIAYDAEGRIAAEFDIECCTYSDYG